MHIRFLKYTIPLLLYISVFHSFSVTGWQIWTPLFTAWVVVPLLELLIKPSNNNLSAAEEELAKKDAFYDAILYVVVVLQYAALIRFLYVMRTDNTMSDMDIAGRIWVMGLICGIFGINVGHELGHRKNKVEQTMAKLLLLTSQYMHFYIEHNKGHHKRVATPDDPSSARYGEWIYQFYYRSIIFGYINAWHIAANDVKKKGRAIISLYNEMFLFTLIQVSFITLCIVFFGWFATICYLLASGIGIFLLETVNYIEHYGLSRKETATGYYERAMPAHSWNSNHVIGRLMLFELSRHSDHHYLASRKYQLLRHHADAPQMPTGYPGMMLLSLVPPLWFYIMNKRIKKYSLLV
jgi:alkane 1-monooxygenase